MPIVERPVPPSMPGTGVTGPFGPGQFPLLMARLLALLGAPFELANQGPAGGSPRKDPPHRTPSSDAVPWICS